MNLLAKWIINAIAIFATGFLLSGVHVQDFKVALIAALVLGIVNATIKPILFLLTLPITILTLGLFTLILNAFLIILTSQLVPGFKVDSFLWAFLFSLVNSVISSILEKIFD